MQRGVVELALGVGHPLAHAHLTTGETVLDLGCGAGIDTLLAALAVGPAGRAIGLDMTRAMVERTRRHAGEMGLENLEVFEGLMEQIPLPDGSVDVVVSNGVLNLATRKSRVLADDRDTAPRPQDPHRLRTWFSTRRCPKTSSRVRRRWPVDWRAHWRSQC